MRIDANKFPTIAAWFGDRDVTPEMLVAHQWNEAGGLPSPYKSRVSHFTSDATRELYGTFANRLYPEFATFGVIVNLLRGATGKGIEKRAKDAMEEVWTDFLANQSGYTEQRVFTLVDQAFMQVLEAEIADTANTQRALTAHAESWYSPWFRPYFIFVTLFEIAQKIPPAVSNILSHHIMKALNEAKLMQLSPTAPASWQFLANNAQFIGQITHTTAWAVKQTLHWTLGLGVDTVRSLSPFEWWRGWKSWRKGEGFTEGLRITQRLREIRALLSAAKPHVLRLLQSTGTSTRDAIKIATEESQKLWQAGKGAAKTAAQGLSVLGMSSVGLAAIGVASAIAGAGVAILLMKYIPGLDRSGWFSHPDPEIEADESAMSMVGELVGEYDEVAGSSLARVADAIDRVRSTSGALESEPDEGPMADWYRQETERALAELERAHEEAAGALQSRYGWDASAVSGGRAALRDVVSAVKDEAEQILGGSMKLGAALSEADIAPYINEANIMALLSPEIGRQLEGMVEEDIRNLSEQEAQQIMETAAAASEGLLKDAADRIAVKIALENPHEYLPQPVVDVIEDPDIVGGPEASAQFALDVAEKIGQEIENGSPSTIRLEMLVDALEGTIPELDAEVRQAAQEVLIEAAGIVAVAKEEAEWQSQQNT